MQKSGQKLRGVGVVFAVVLAVIAGACGTQSPSESTPAPAADVLSTLASDVSSGFFKTTDSVMANLGFGPADDGTEKEASVTSPEVVTRTPRPRSTPPVVPAVVAPEPLLETGSRLMAIEAPAAIVPTAYELPPRVDDLIVYTVADFDVIPPIMRSIDPPSWRPSDGHDADAVEVVVSQEGSVDRIKLVSESRRMIDTMVLSAAKMWKFEPALKDGEPVRYRLILQSPRTASYR